MKRKLITVISVLLVAVSLFQILLTGCVDQTSSEDATTTTRKKSNTKTDKTSDPVFSTNGLIISEVMASNSSGYIDEFGENSDWIEICNPTEQSISLNGVYLSDEKNRLSKYPLPSGELAPGAYLLVLASDRNTVTSAGEIHANFKISAGERVTLSKNNNMITFIDIPDDLANNISYGLVGSADNFTKVYFASPTPGSANSGSYSETLSELSLLDSGLRINEFMMKNVMTLYDEDGDCPDWVEIFNGSGAPISLKGYGLSDKFSNPMKWKFPDITIGADEYIIVLLSGKDKTYGDGSEFLHASFKLSDDDDGLMISNPSGLLVDRIEVVPLPESVSYGRDTDDTSVWKFYPNPTPGTANSTEGFDSLEFFLKAQTEKLYINEVCAVSSSSVKDLPDDDWIELYNNTEEPIDLEGWSLSKSVSDLRQYTFPSVTIPAHDYLVIKAGGTASTNVKKLSTGFSVKFSGTTLYLTDPEGRITDSFETGYQRAGITSGRVIEDGMLVRKFFSTPSKGEENVSNGSSQAYAQPAVIESDTNNLISAQHTVKLSTLTKNASIYYTLDGTVPNSKSPKYEGPINITESSSLRAIVYADGLLPSDVTTQTFLVDDPHDLGIVCLTCEPDDLFGYTNGIWADGPGWTEKSPHKGANYWMEWERPVYFEYYEPDGKLGVSFSAGIKNHGQYSRARSQKSVSINLKEAYGSSTCHYPFFGTDDLSVFDNLVLRTGSQDSVYTNIMDAYCARVVRGQMDLDIMRDLPVAVYVNGEYWGLYFIRDKINESYVYYRQGIEDDNLDMIKGNGIIESGTNTAHRELLEYINTHDLSKQEYFDYVATQIDLDEWSNYWITESFFANTDTGNIRFYRSRDDDGKWRWILFDLDWALFRSTYKWNMISAFIDPRGHGVGRRFSTTIAVGLFKNKEFKDQFIRKYAEYLHTVFSTDRLISILDEMVSEIETEMPRQYQRWKSLSVTQWEKNIDRLRSMLVERWDKSVTDLKTTFKLSDSMMAELFPELYE